MATEKKHSKKKSKLMSLTSWKNSIFSPHTEKKELPPNTRRTPVKAIEEEKKEIGVNPHSPLLQSNTETVLEHTEISTDIKNNTDISANSAQVEKKDFEEINASLKSFRIKKKNKLENTKGLGIKEDLATSLTEDGAQSQENPLEKAQMQLLEDAQVDRADRTDKAKQKNPEENKGKNIRVNASEQYALTKERFASGQSKVHEAYTSAWQWTFTMRPASVITGLFLMLITLGFFFTFGIFVGRGLTPSATPLNLASIVPTSESPLLDTKMTILKPEELQFAEVLKKVADPEPTADPIILDENGQPLPQAVEGIPIQMVNGMAIQVIDGVPVQVVERQETAPYPIGIQQASATITPTAVVSSTATPVKAIVPIPLAEPEKYDFIIKAASFRTAQRADELRARLEGDGLRTQLERSSSWFIVKINFRGTEASLKDLQRNLKKHSIGDSIVESKTALTKA